MTQKQMTLEEAVRAASAWTELDGVEIVGASKTREGKDCIFVQVSSAAAAARLPKTFEGYEVVIEQGDKVHAQ